MSLVSVNGPQAVADNIDAPGADAASSAALSDNNGSLAGSASSLHDPTLEIIDSMEQGVLVWSPDGDCVMHNQRIFEVLELRSDDIYKGRPRHEFLGLAVTRGEITAEKAAQTERRFRNSAPFQFDRTLPSGRVVSTNARPMASGGFVVTFTDVTASRKNESELAEAIRKAEDSEARAMKSLRSEQARQREMLLLSELDEWLQSCQSLAELFQIVTSFMSRLLPNTAGELYIYSNSRDVLDGSCHWNCDGTVDHIQPEACWSLRRGRPYEYGSGTISMKCSHLDHLCGDESELSYLCLPIVAHGDTVGLLHIRFDVNGSPCCDDNQFDDVRRFAMQCAEHISLAIANVKLRDELRDQSTRDALTGLFNRRYFLEGMRSEIARAQRNENEFGLISFDADNFKVFNDNHGHDAGDVVLREVADCMRALFSENEVLSRFGGEEFSILLPGATAAETFEAADRLRAAVGALNINYGGKRLPTITISGGVASYPADGKFVQDMLNVADRALYRAKAEGRDKMCKSSDLPQALPGKVN
ncbi:MAG: diguanylate cyclase [Pseudomonadota bacterium]